MGVTHKHVLLDNAFFNTGREDGCLVHTTACSMLWKRSFNSPHSFSKNTGSGCLNLWVPRISHPRTQKRQKTLQLCVLGRYTGSGTERNLKLARSNLSSWGPVWIFGMFRLHQRKRNNLHRVFQITGTKCLSVINRTSLHVEKPTFDVLFCSRF